jgi:hypothetical protein
MIHQLANLFNGRCLRIFEIFTAMKIQVEVFWSVTQCDDVVE